MIIWYYKEKNIYIYIYIYIDAPPSQQQSHMKVYRDPSQKIYPGIILANRSYRKGHFRPTKQ